MAITNHHLNLKRHFQGRENDFWFSCQHIDLMGSTDWPLTHTVKILFLFVFFPSSHYTQWIKNKSFDLIFP